MLQAKSVPLQEADCARAVGACPSYLLGVAVETQVGIQRDAKGFELRSDCMIWAAAVNIHCDCGVQ